MSENRILLSALHSTISVAWRFQRDCDQYRKRIRELEAELESDEEVTNKLADDLWKIADILGVVPGRQVIPEVKRIKSEVDRYRSFCGEALCGDVEHDRDEMGETLEGLLARVRQLNEQQADPDTHPYTCPNRGDGKHHVLWNDVGELVLTPSFGWVCPSCWYRQPFDASGNAAASAG